MLNISQTNRDTVLNSHIERKDDFLFLSNHIISSIQTNNKPNRLYNNLTSFLNGHELKERPKADNIESMKRHKGYASHSGHLSDSQRSVLNSLNSMKSGDFITLSIEDKNTKIETIKNIVFTSYITQALGDGPSPVIFYTGDDNSIKDVLESFTELENNAKDNILYKHWLQNIDYTATYVNDTYVGTKYQHITKDGEGFITKADVFKKIEEDKKLMIYNCYLIFNVSYNDLSSCKNALYSRLYQLNDDKGRILDLFVELKNKEISIDFKKDFDTLRIESENKINDIEQEIELIKNRLNQWKEYFENEPKGLSFLMKNKLKRRFDDFIIESEKDLITDTMSFDDVSKIYDEKILLKENSEAITLETEKLKVSLFDLLNSLKKNGVDITNEINNIDIDEINEIMDSTVRYHELWYAIHYYECRWLMGEFSLKENVKHSITKENIEKRYKRLAMVSPLLVSKFIDLPYNMFAYVSKDKPIFPMYDFIDTLIIDNADSIPTGIAASTFYLAKKAVIIGNNNPNKDSILLDAGHNTINVT